MGRPKVHASASAAARAAEARLREAGGKRKVLRLDAAAVEGLARLKRANDAKSESAVVMALIAIAVQALTGKQG